MNESATNRRLIIVSNRLPFQLKEVKGKAILKESDGGLVSALRSVLERDTAFAEPFNSVCWIGSADFPEKRWIEFQRQEKKQQAFEVEPIFVEKKTYNAYYNGFCNATLWPLFHYFPSYVEYDDKTFQSYEEVNKIFADRLSSIIQPNDIIWIHDYQLFLLPGLIREKTPEAIIGFFLHIPFPSYEVFRLLHRPWKEKIISGLLGADLIGFHTHEYVQHFLKTVRMVKGFDHQFRAVYTDDRVIKADLFPLGIDYYKFHDASKNLDVQRHKETIFKNFSGKKIIFSVDRLDYTKGVTHRLAGFEHFLERYPEWKEQVVFILVVIPSRQIISKYNERLKLIEEQVGGINGRYSSLTWQPIIYRYNKLSFSELCALYEAADIALITPLRDGMNLVAKEYVASRVSQNGVLILSELAGAANELGESILVNPVDQDEMSQAIYAALTMPLQDQQRNMSLMQRRLKDYDVIHWVNDFLKQLLEVKEQQHSQEEKNLTRGLRKNILKTFREASGRHLFLDYDGTLVPFARHPRDAKPDKNILELINTLSADPKTEVTIISGRDGNVLEEWFQGLRVNLVAEHGASIRSKDGLWKYSEEADQSWKPLIKPTMELFMQRSPRSFIEEKSHTIAWHYRNVDPELGFIRSRELLDNLFHLVRNGQLQVIDGNKVIEVRMTGLDKGFAARSLMEANPVDFVMAIGDDVTDEDMFKALADKAVTIKVGTGAHTSAQYSIPTQKDVINFLNQLKNE
jgi:trehalose 6-phosphate synthase/phosphatase